MTKITRQQIFTKQFALLYKSNPDYERIKKVYITQPKFSIASARVLMNMVKYKKDGTINKNSINNKTKLDQALKKYEKKPVVKLNQKLHSLKLTYKDVDIGNKKAYTINTHRIQIRKMMRKHPNKVYRHTVEYYSGDDELLSNKTFTYIEFRDTGDYENELDENGFMQPIYEEILTNIKFNNFQWIGQAKDLTKAEIDAIQYKMSDAGGSEGIWNVRAFIEARRTIQDMNAYVIINTYAYDIITTDIIKEKFKYDAQTFRLNETGTCVYDGLLKYFDNSEDKRKKARYNRLIKNELEYKKPYTVDNIHTIAQLVDCSIKISNLVNGETHIYNESSYNRYCIEFINSRYNHVDLYLNNQDEPTVLNNKDEYNEIKNNSEYYVEKYNKLYTLDKVYKIADSKFKIIFDEWKKTNNFETLSIFINDPTYKFLSHYDYDLHRFFNDFEIKDDLYQEYDIKKAYYNYSDVNYNKFYMGVPSGSFINVKYDDFKLTDFEDHIKNNLVGFYEIEITKHIFNYDFNKLGFTIGSKHVLYTSMIQLLKDKIEFKFLNMSYAPSVHIPFNSNFLEKDEKGIKHYCKAFGIFIGSNNIQKTEIKILKEDEKDYSIIHKPNAQYYKNKNIINIIERDENKKVYHHIGYAMHAYINTLVLDEIFNHDINDIFGVKLDSIVFKKDYEIISPLTNLFENGSLSNNAFSHKEPNVESLLLNDDDDNNYSTYISSISISRLDMNFFDEDDEDDEDNKIQFSKIININKDMVKSGYFKPFITSSNVQEDFKPIFTQDGQKIFKRIVFIGGKGGSGKTQGIMTFFDPKTTCFSSSCWNLIQGQKNKYPNLIGLSVNKLEGKTYINKNDEEEAKEDDKKDEIKEETEEPEPKKKDEIKIQKSEKASNKNIRRIALDEATLLHHESITSISNSKSYESMFIFVMGDIDQDNFYYQCSNRNNVINDFSKMQYISYSKSYRFDNELNTNLDNLRKQMKYIKSVIKDNDKKALYALKYWFFNSPFKQCIKDINDIKFNDDDVGISCNNEMGKASKKLTEQFIKLGAKPQYFIKTTNLNKNQLRGQEITEEETKLHKNYEMKLFKTIHSFQGLDLTETNKIIIDLSSIFDYNIIYTAMSRARRMDQIIIIK